MPTASNQDDFACELRHVPLKVEVQFDHVETWIGRMLASLRARRKSKDWVISVYWTIPNYQEIEATGWSNDERSVDRDCDAGIVVGLDYRNCDVGIVVGLECAAEMRASIWFRAVCRAGSI